jgi:hypothetical protein
MTQLDFPFSRRHLLKGVSAAGALAACGFLNSVFAKAPMLGTQAPAFYRFKIGDFKATIATDGGCRSAILTRTTSDSLRRRPTGSCPRISCRRTDHEGEAVTGSNQVQ